jgi:hypothetical protein
MERLTELTRFYMAFSSSPDYPHIAGEVGALPRDCEVNTHLYFTGRPLSLPAGLISQITHMDFCIECGDDWPEQALEDEEPVMDFDNPVWPNLSQASSLKAFKLDCMERIVVRGVGVLPQSCKRLEFCCLDLQLSLASIDDDGFLFGEVKKGQHGQKVWVLNRD